MYVSKWYSLSAGAVCELVAGVAYTFSLYAPALKAALNLSQPELEGVGSAILCGGLTAWLPGLLYDYLMPYDKLGPRLTALIGLVTHFVGYITIWAVASGTINAPYWLLVAAGLFASSGLLWLDTASIVTNMRNFPAERGPIAGILKTFLGLSASIATSVYSGAYAPRGLDFLLFLAIAPTALGLLVLPLLNHVPHVEEDEIISHGKKLTTERRLLGICGIIGLLLIYQMATALFSRQHANAKLAIMVVALLVLAASIVIVPVGTGGLRSKPARLHDSLEVEDGGRSSQSPLLPHSASTDRMQRRATGPAVEEGAASAASSSARQSSREASPHPKAAAPREWSLGQCLASADFWMLWTAMLIGIGSGFTLLNNLGQHVEALNAKPGAQDVYVLLFTTFNCLGRMLGGFGSEWLLHKYALPRTAVLLGLSLGSALIYAAVALAGLETLLACSVLAGLAFGAHWALMPCCTSDLFGPRHFAANQSIVHLSTAVGALLLSTELAATLFQQKGAAHGDPPTACFGADCFRGTYLVISSLALLQSGFSLLLHIRSRPLYAQIYIKLRKFEEEVHT